MQGILNAALFMPVGFSSYLALRKVAYSVFLCATLAVLTEFAQSMVPTLTRLCESTDATNNILGAVAGVGAGWIYAFLRANS